MPQRDNTIETIKKLNALLEIGGWQWKKNS